MTNIYIQFNTYIYSEILNFSVELTILDRIITSSLRIFGKANACKPRAVKKESFLVIYRPIFTLWG